MPSHGFASFCPCARPGIAARGPSAGAWCRECGGRLWRVRGTCHSDAQQPLAGCPLLAPCPSCPGWRLPHPADSALTLLLGLISVQRAITGHHWNFVRNRPVRWLQMGRADRSHLDSASLRAGSSVPASGRAGHPGGSLQLSSGPARHPFPPFLHLPSRVGTDRAQWVMRWCACTLTRGAPLTVLKSPTCSAPASSSPWPHTCKARTPDSRARSAAHVASPQDTSRPGLHPFGPTLHLRACCRRVHRAWPGAASPFGADLEAFLEEQARVSCLWCLRWFWFRENSVAEHRTSRLTLTIPCSDSSWGGSTYSPGRGTPEVKASVRTVAACSGRLPPLPLSSASHLSTAQRAQRGVVHSSVPECQLPCGGSCLWGGCCHHWLFPVFNSQLSALPTWF